MSGGTGTDIVEVTDGRAPKERIYNAFLDEVVQKLAPIGRGKKIYAGMGFPSEPRIFNRIIRKNSYFNRQIIACIDYSPSDGDMNIEVCIEEALEYIKSVAEKNKDKFDSIKIEKNF